MLTRFFFLSQPLRREHLPARGGSAGEGDGGREVGAGHGSGSRPRLRQRRPPHAHWERDDRGQDVVGGAGRHDCQYAEGKFGSFIVFILVGEGRKIFLGGRVYIS